VAIVPTRVRWTDHALEKASWLGIARGDIERAVLERHPARQRNARSADWRVISGRFVILYDHPDHGDATTTRIVTLWRRR